MPRNLTDYRVFIATPGGLQEERTLFKEVLEDFNLADANHRGLNFTPVGWEITLGGLGRPQELIDQDVLSCDYFVMLLHDRWGTPPGAGIDGRLYTSGTEEEFNVALKAYQEGQIRDILLLFKHVDEKRLSDPGEQLASVLAFRKEREARRDLLFHSFDHGKAFGNVLRRHLSSWVRKLEQKNGDLQEFEVKATKENFVRRPNTSLPATARGNAQAYDLVSDAEARAEAGAILEAEVLFSRVVSTTDDPWVLARYGRFLRKIGHLVTARAILQRAIELSDLGRNLEVEAYAYKQLGLIHARTDSPETGIAQLGKAIELYGNVDSPENMAKCYREIGLIQNKLGKHGEAAKAFSDALDLLSPTADTKVRASILGFLGVSYRSQGDLDRAEFFQREALRLVENSGDRRSLAPIWANLGNILRQRGELTEALSYNERALKTYEDLGDKQGIARERSNIGNCLRLLGRHKEALTHFNESLVLAEVLGNRQGVAFQLASLGLVYQELGELHEAERLHIRALEIFDQLKSLRYQAQQYENIGRIYRMQHLFDEAEIRLTRARELYQSGRFPQGLATVQFERGLLALEREDREAARSELAEAHSSLSDLGLTLEAARARAALAAIDDLPLADPGN
jgi:tetratricopeptide (TPR) repeat protein